MRDNGHEPNIINYLKTPPSTQKLSTICDLLKLRPSDIIRTNEKDYKNLNIGGKELGDNALIKCMVKHPRIIERPIVIRGNKAVIGRPPENVLKLI